MQTNHPRLPPQNSDAPVLGSQLPRRWTETGGYAVPDYANHNAVTLGNNCGTIMTLTEKLREIIATEDAALDAPAPFRPCPMDKDGKHMWQRTWAEWAKHLARQRCACGAPPPPAAYPEI